MSRSDAMTARQAAARLRASGIAPCKPDPREKKPAYPGWSTHSLEPDDFRDGDMIGVLGGPLSNGNRAGHALVVVDLDSAEAVANADAHLPATGMSEGRASKPRSHRYYLVPHDSVPLWACSTAEQGSAAAKNATGHPGPFKKAFDHRDTGKRVIDFIGTGGQVVCPPSLHESGEVREWDGGRPGEPAIVPFLALWRAVCELAAFCGAEIPNVIPRPARPAGPRLAVPADALRERARKYLAKLPPSVSGSGGHNAAMWAARCMVWGFDLEPDLALDLLLSDFNLRCAPPWSERELRHKIEDADRIPFDKPRGWLRDEPGPERNGHAHMNGASRPKAPGVSRSAGADGANADPPADPPLCTDANRLYPPPRSGEAWDDPHRLARLYVDAHRTDGREPTIAQWREEFHRWGGAAWRPVPDSDLDAELARHCRAVFEGDLPFRAAEAALRAESGAKPPTLYKVTAALKTNTRLNLAGQVNLPDAGADPPFWRGGAAGRPSASEVIAAPNGLFTIADVALGNPAYSPPTPEFFTPNALPFTIQADPPQPETWLRCLNEWLNKDAASILGLQEAMGLMLSSETRAQKIVMFVGPKRSGKGTVLRIIAELVGESNVAGTTFQKLGEPFGLQPLLGRTVAMIPDARLSNRTDLAAVVERLLSISGEDVQSVNRKNLPIVSTRLKARFVISTNEIPHLLDPSGALASRFHILSFPNSFFGKEDTGLEEKLRAELPGILVWAARGFVRFRAQGYRFTTNDAAEQHRRELEDLSNPVRAFVRERCRTEPGCEVRVAELYQSWCDWNSARRSEPGSEQVFGRNLRAAFPHVRMSQPRRDGNRVRVYVGIDLRARADWGEDDAHGQGVGDGVERDGTRTGSAHVKDEEAA